MSSGNENGRSRVTLERGDIEYEWIDPVGPTSEPPLVFLHEGLGSIDLWRGYPAAVTAHTGRRSLVYSRHGHGWSSPVTESRTFDYMHREADRVLPPLLAELGVERSVLVGHSDGASIALLYAGAGHLVDALVLLAPHVFVEDRSVAGIEAARHSYETTDLPARMGRYHRDAASTFWGWNRAWLAPEFREWNIESALATVDCPVLAIQGIDDAYGTLAQLDAVEAGVSGSFERLVLENCGHAPHIDQEAAVTAATARFIASLGQPRR